MNRCPYCYDVIESKKRPPKCPHCHQFLVDEMINLSYPPVEKKPCLFCGKKINKEASFCKYCQKWLDEFDQKIRDAENIIEDGDFTL